MTTVVTSFSVPFRCLVALHDMSYGKIRANQLRRKDMDKEKIKVPEPSAHSFLLILAEVLVVLLMPFRLISALFILIVNLFCIRYGLKMKRWLTLRNRDKIQQASTVAESNLNYVSRLCQSGSSLINHDTNH